MDLTDADWRGYRRPDFPAASWIFEDDTLRALGTAERVDLTSRRRYRDFAFSFECRLPPGGNSGVLYRVSEDLAESWQSGPEMQLLDDLRHPDGQNPLTACGALYGLLAPRKTNLPPVDIFIRARVVVRGSKIEHWVNDIPVLGYDLADPVLRERIAASKFKSFPRFAREDEGHLVLQHHGTDAWFRDLRIEPL